MSLLWLLPDSKKIISDPHKNLYMQYVLYYRDASYKTHTLNPDFDRICTDL